MKIATLKHHWQAALIQQERLYIISSALQRHGLPTLEGAKLTTIDLLTDWKRNLDLLVKLSGHLDSDEHYQLVAEVELPPLYCVREKCSLQGPTTTHIYANLGR